MTGKNMDDSGHRKRLYESTYCPSNKLLIAIGITIIVSQLYIGMLFVKTYRPRRVLVTEVKSKNVASKNSPEPNVSRKYSSRPRYKKACTDKECEAFRKMMETWPAYKPKAAIYVLVTFQLEVRCAALLKMLKSLDDNFNRKFKYPVVIMYERSTKRKAFAITGKNLTSAHLYYQQVVLNMPSFIKNPPAIVEGCVRHEISYRNMCRFMSKTVYELPIFEGLDYLWRLDDDSLILSNIDYDLFRFMSERGFLYGYIAIIQDNPNCVKGLWKAARLYAVKKNIQHTFFDLWPNGTQFYNNFEIGSMKLWTSIAYKRYIRFIDRSGGFYFHRWGDAPVKSVGVSLLVPSSQTHYFGDIAYKHQELLHLPNN